MCFGYGCTREILGLIDMSGSMSGSILLNIGLQFMREVATRLDCRCPRWAVAGYRTQASLAAGIVVPMEWLAFGDLPGGNTEGNDAAGHGRHLKPFRRRLTYPELTDGIGGLGYAGDATEIPHKALEIAAKVWDKPDTVRTYVPVIPGNPGENLEGFPGLDGRSLVTGKRRPPRRIILWCGDESSGDQEQWDETISALVEAEITVVGLNMLWEGAGIDAASPGEKGMATQMAEATGGCVFHNLMDAVGAWRYVAHPTPGPLTWETDYFRWDMLLNRVRDTLLALKWTPEGYPYESTRPEEVSVNGDYPTILNP